MNTVAAAASICMQLLINERLRLADLKARPDTDPKDVKISMLREKLYKYRYQNLQERLKNQN